MDLYPTDGTKTRRRKLRADIRHWLGTSREDAPSLTCLFAATRRLDELVKLTTHGRYRIVITRPDRNPEIPGWDELREAGQAWSE